MEDNISTFLEMDTATYKRTYIEVAHIYVEMDLGFDLPKEIFLDSDNPQIEGYWQALQYPKFMYCAHCHMVGHCEQFC